MFQTHVDSPVGPLLLSGTEDALHGIHFSTETPAVMPAAGLGGVLVEAKRQLDAYFAGDLRRFDLPLAFDGTEFQARVWRLLTDIEYGETRSYGELASRLGNPNASRAVGAANGRNPISIVVPCHRVIGADGSLTGFGGGLPIKRFLLELERRSGQMRLI